MALTLTSQGVVAEEADRMTVAQLAAPCAEADNDARQGAPAEAECEAYILGFVDALRLSGGIGPSQGICLPEQNLADDVRWAFMRWVYTDYSNNTKMPAAKGLMAALRTEIACR